MNALHWLEIAELSDLVARREVSPVEITQAQLDRIERLDPELHSYVHVMADAAVLAAREAEREIMAGRYRGPLHGVPIGIKDLFWTKDVPTAGGMAIHREFRPSHDATSVERLRGAGAVVLGKLQLTEGAYSDHHPSINPPINPWNEDYWTGISSSGPATALAAGLCYGALASDTGGSIRWPCGANGLSGIKPTWGRVSRDGAWPLAPSMDHVGTMARSVADAATMLAVIAGPDTRDPTTLPRSLSQDDTKVEGLIIGIDPRWNEEDIDPPVRFVVNQAVETFRTLGANLVEVQAPVLYQSTVDWPDLCAVEAAVAHAATYPARKEEYGPVLASVIERGRAIMATDYQRLLLRRLELQGAFESLFTRIDLLLCPVQPFAPLTLETLGTMGKKPELIARLQRFTCAFDMTGEPAVTLPGGHDDQGMPIGFQLIAALQRDNVAVMAGSAFQRSTAHHKKHPPLDEYRLE